MSPDRLLVYHLRDEVGLLQRGPGGGLQFSYSADWLRAGGFALATSLPLREGAQETSFFANLLPEAGARQRIANALGISADNDFELLRRLGADCAGALQILPDLGSEVEPETEPAPGQGAATILPAGERILPLKPADGPKLASRAGFATFFKPGQRVRLSLAGAQNKLAVVETATGLAVPLDGRPSSHVLKLPNPDFKGLVENEALVLSLAARLGLPVVEHRVVNIGTARCLLLHRYDRSFSGPELRRLHQQDLCQALGLAPEIKYESEGGPSLAQVFALVRAEVADPLSASQALLRWAIFNVLVHNADAHAKNVSLLRAEDGRQSLAPFYDLICTGAYDLDHRMAMAIGGQLDPGNITPARWRQLAQDIGVGAALVEKTVQDLGERIPKLLTAELSRLDAQLGHFPRRQQLKRAILRRTRKALSLLEA